MIRLLKFKKSRLIYLRFTFGHSPVILYKNFENAA